MLCASLKRWGLHAAGLTKEAEATAEGEYREIEGVLIGPGGSAVAEDGTVLSVSKLTLLALRAELIARGLSVEGKRRDLYRRVQVLGSCGHVPHHALQHAHARLQEMRVPRCEHCVFQSTPPAVV